MTKHDGKEGKEKSVGRPNRFVSLHNHTGFSPYDGLDYPDAHFEFCMENGLDAHAITEHGQLNSYAHAQLWIEEWAKKNPKKSFKYIPGCEIYFHPNLEEWRHEKTSIEEARTKKKLDAKMYAAQAKRTKQIVDRKSVV